MRRTVLLLTATLTMVVATQGVAAGASVTGTAASEYIFGTASNDTLRSRGGNDILLGGPGKDTLKLTGSGIGLMIGGPGRDTIINAGSSAAVLVDEDGTPGDEFVGNDQDEEFYAADGAKDTIDCGKGVDIAFVDRVDRVRRCENVLRRSLSGFYLVGNDDANSLPSLGQSVILSGLGGGDTLSGSAATVHHHPGAGTDLVTGGTGTDFVYDGDADTDTFNTDDGEDIVIGGGVTGTTIDCGLGTDRAVIFTGDLAPTNCETVVSGVGQAIPI